MKHLVAIGLVVLLALAACHSSHDDAVETRHGASLQPVASPELSAIDSLMWQRPDSALLCLLPYFDTYRDAARHVSTDETFNNHYAHLLLAELLYKNDYAQTNRAELLQAVGYFDSLLVVADTRGVSLRQHHRQPFRRHCGRAPQSPMRNGYIPFLSARAHYINGVGYYEQDSVVEACREYLAALEIMENRFSEKDLVGEKARFMVYTYNRLGDIFEGQLLAEPAIVCYKQALSYCRREPTSIYGIPVLLYHIGIQYDIVNQKDSALFYYDKALANMPNPDNIHYRDIITAKTVLDFNLGFCVDSVINNLKYVISLTKDNHEKVSRFLTLGNILFESKQYNSSRLYLETVFEQQDDIVSKIVAAENLFRIYQIEGDSAKARQYSSYLADFTMEEIEKKKDVSKINEMFKNHLIKKQEKQSKIEREKAVKKAIGIIVPIAVAVTLTIIFVLKLKSKKLLKEQQEVAERVLGEAEQEHEKELKLWQAEAEKVLEERDKRYAESIEAEQQAHRMEQAALSGRLKRSNQELRELKDKIQLHEDKRQASEASAASFTEEPICRLIMERVDKGQFKTKVDYVFYKDYALDKQQLSALRMAADRHFGQFTTRLKKAYPTLTNSDLDYCCLYLLGLTDADIAALMQRAYNTVIERNGKLRKIFGSDNSLFFTLSAMTSQSSFV